MKTTMTSIAGAVALAFAVVAPVLGEAPKRPAAPAANVQVAVTENTKLAPARWVPGSVVSRDDARIASGAAGRIDSIAEVGTRVPAGGVLARLDDTALRLRLDEVKAEHARAQAQSELAQRQFTRLNQLAPNNAVAATQMDEVRAQRDSAGHELARTQARVREIEHELSQTQVRAPFAGIVTERFAQRGEWVQVGAAVAHLVDVEHLELRVQAPLALAAHVRSGSALAIRGHGSEVSSKVRAVVPVGDAQSRQFELRVALPAGYALVGTALEAALPESSSDAALTVPRDALVLREKRTYVMRVKADNTAEAVDVQPGIVEDTRVAVRGALEAGDRVVVRGAERLSPGQSVKVVGPG